MDKLPAVSADEELRARIRFQEKAERDRTARLNHAIQKGIKIGMQEGMEKGMEKGRFEEKRALAKNLLDVLDDETIALKLGLGRDEVAALRAQQGI